MKLFLLKLANRFMDVLLKIVSAIPPSCPHHFRNVRYEERRMWRSPWATKMVAICTDCEWELQQQRNATGW